MLRSSVKLTGALCLFAYATTVMTPAAMAVGSGSDPILHVIETDKKKEKGTEAAAAKETVGSGSAPVLHILDTDKKDTKKEAKSSSTKKKTAAKSKSKSKSTAKAKSTAKPKPKSKSVAKAKPKATKQTAKAKSTPSSKQDYAKLIRKAAAKHGVPVKIAKAVVEVESNFNPSARGRAGEVGLMQIKPATARGIGYRGSTKGLYDPETNLEWGMKYLAGAHKRAGGDLCGTILRYNAGHYAKRMNPISRRYCTKVKRILASS
ncbi:lytic transglycosylase domain-containing protein [Roseibium sp. SCP14]|uniref:lytic transglycosylase domain-containing protein n=1 Tax=Roseibium sp. SCP14 TaxID=3141375 RepID=UPI003A984DEC